MNNLPRNTRYASRNRNKLRKCPTKYNLRIITYEFISKNIQNKPNFQKSQMNVIIYYTKLYNEKNAFMRIQNKPNQSQFKPNDGFSAYYPTDCHVAEFTLNAAEGSLAIKFSSSESFRGFHFECQNAKIAQRTLISGLLLYQVGYVPA